MEENHLATKDKQYRQTLPVLEAEPPTMASQLERESLQAACNRGRSRFRATI